jgi:ATP-dependent DNA ligase I
MLLRAIADTSEAVRATRSRKEKTERLAALLQGADPEEAGIAVCWLSGELPQRQIGVGWAALKDLPAPADEPSLQAAEVEAAFSAIGLLSGPGSQTGRRQRLAELFARADPAEQGFLRGLLLGDLRQGALAGVMADAVARAAGIPLADVRRAAMLAGDLAAVARAALADGATGLAAFRLQVGRPLQPMLAATAKTVDEALEKVCPAAVEWKLDGIRVQVHRDGDEVAIFTRSLDDITSRVPELVAAARSLPLRTVVLDGEAIALRDDGRPHPFQVTGSRGVPLSLFLFDVLHADGQDVLDLPGADRQAVLTQAAPEPLRIPRTVATSADEAAEALAAAVGQGHEGVMVKSLEAPYEAGRRGAGWLKVKPVHTLDLVVLAVEWGHGRRRGWLSNLHLGARDPENGGFVMLGKTFKGLTDAMLTWQTQRLLELESHRDAHTVYVRPELVVEIAFDGVQRSTRYPGGVALRFARVLRHRPDKSALEADTIEAVRAFGA